MSVVLLDTFRGTPGAELSTRAGESLTWVKHPVFSGAGDLVITDANRVRSGVSGGTPLYISEQDHPAEFDLPFRVKVKSLSDRAVYALFRAHPTVFQYAGAGVDSSGLWYLWEEDLTDYYELGTWQDTLVDEAERFAFVEVRNDRLRLVIDGHVRVVSSAAALTSGTRLGVFGAPAGAMTNAAGIHLDEISALSGQVSVDGSFDRWAFAEPEIVLPIVYGVGFDAWALDGQPAGWLAERDQRVHAPAIESAWETLTAATMETAPPPPAFETFDVWVAGEPAGLPTVEIGSLFDAWVGGAPVPSVAAPPADTQFVGAPALSAPWEALAPDVATPLTSVGQEINLSPLGTPENPGSHWLRFTLSKDQAGGETIMGVVALVEGSTVLAERHAYMTDVATQHDFLLRNDELPANYGALALRFTALYHNDGAPREARFHWAQFQTPDAAATLAFAPAVESPWETSDPALSFAQDVAAPFLVSTWEALDPVVTAGPISVSAPVLEAAWATVAPDVEFDLFAAAPAIDAPWETAAPDVVAGGLSVSAPAIESAWTAETPTAEAVTPVAATAIESAWTAETPTASPVGPSVSAPVLSAPWETLDPDVAQTGLASAPAVSAPWEALAPTATAGPVSVAAPALDSPWTAVAPTTTALTLVQAPALEAAWTASQPSASTGTLQVPAPAIEAAWTVLAPDAVPTATAAAPAIDVAWAAVAPTAIGGPVSVSAPAIESAWVALQPDAELFSVTEFGFESIGGGPTIGVERAYATASVGGSFR